MHGLILLTSTIHKPQLTHGLCLLLHKNAIGRNVLHENDVKKLNEGFCTIENGRCMLEWGEKM
mgnify:FL=1